MLIIDTQCHVALNWFEPVEAALYHMDAHGVAHAVLIQPNASYDNTYILECARRHQDRFKAVVLLHPHDKSKTKALAEMHKQGAAGFRMSMKSEWDADDPVFKRAGELGMVVDINGDAAGFASARFKKLLDNCPDTRFCIEHLARSPRAGGNVAVPPHEGYKAALECARWPNTTLKVPGLGEILERPTPLPIGYPFEQWPPLFEMAKEAFGVQRMMWGSHFPACCAQEGYGNVLRGVRDHPAFQAGDDAEWVMGKSAAKLWGFGN